LRICSARLSRVGFEVFFRQSGMIIDLMLELIRLGHRCPANP
jgi:hypothetical protein